MCARVSVAVNLNHPSESICSNIVLPVTTSEFGIDSR